MIWSIAQAAWPGTSALPVVNRPRITGHVGVAPDSSWRWLSVGGEDVTQQIMTNCSTRVEFDNYKASYLLL